MRSAVSMAVLVAAVHSAAEPPPSLPILNLPTAAERALATPGAVEPTLDQLVADLGSTDFHARDLATLRLREDKSIRLAQIENVLVSADLSLEARARLTTIAREKFSASPRAAMGVKFDLQTLPHRIVIDDTIPPFDSTRVLESGDIIIEAEGVPLVGTGARPLIQGLIISRDPGDTMTLVIRRGKERLTLPVTLGDFRHLENNSLDEVRLYRAWKTRSRNYDLADVPIRPEVHLDAWPDAIELSRQRQLQQMKGQPHSPSMVVHAGGRARTSNLTIDSSWYPAQARGLNGGRLNVWGGGANPQALQALLDFDDPSPRPPMTHADELDRLRKRRFDLSAVLERSVREVGRPSIAPGEAAILHARSGSLERTIRAVDRQIEAVETEAAELGTAAQPKQSSAASAEE